MKAKVKAIRERYELQLRKYLRSFTKLARTARGKSTSAVLLSPRRARVCVLVTAESRSLILTESAAETRARLPPQPVPRSTFRFHRVNALISRCVFR